MDFARSPRRAPLTARKKGSGYENEHAAVNAANNFMKLLFPPSCYGLYKPLAIPAKYNDYGQNYYSALVAIPSSFPRSHFPF